VITAAVKNNRSNARKLAGCRHSSGYDGHR